MDASLVCSPYRSRPLKAKSTAELSMADGGRRFHGAEKSVLRPGDPAHLRYWSGGKSVRCAEWGESYGTERDEQVGGGDAAWPWSRAMRQVAPSRPDSCMLAAGSGGAAVKGPGGSMAWGEVGLLGQQHRRQALQWLRSSHQVEVAIFGCIDLFGEGGGQVLAVVPCGTVLYAARPAHRSCEGVWSPRPSKKQHHYHRSQCSPLSPPFLVQQSTLVASRPVRTSSVMVQVLMQGLGLDLHKPAISKASVLYLKESHWTAHKIVILPHGAIEINILVIGRPM